MPAQWPIFINNLSSKLASKNSTGPDDIGEFFANEYFNAVKTSQTPFGNIHQPGQKSILENAFKKAFNILYDSVEPMLNDKFENSIYEDMFESFPKINLKQDPLCDMEKWINSNTDKILPFQFYQFFASTCPLDSNEEDVFGKIEILPSDISSAIETSNPNIVTMKVTGGSGVAPYIIKYKLNGVEFDVTTDSQGVSTVDIPTIPGEYTYTFISAIDSTGIVKLNDVNQTASVIIKPDGIPPEIVITQEKPRKIVPELSEEKRAEEVAKRVLLQNDGSDYFKRWVENIDVNSTSSFIKNVKDKVKKWLKDGVTFNNVLNSRIFQEEHAVHVTLIPEWLTKEYIIFFTYDKESNKYDSKSEYKKKLSNKDPFGARYVSKYLKNKDASSIELKKIKYKIEEDRWNELKRKWVKDVSENITSDEGSGNQNDAYYVMAEGIIDYWKSTAASPFKPTPPILPCNIPSPGKFTPISYGSKEKLANDLRKAWNTGKQFKTQKALKPATKVVSTAVAVSCAKHLINLKFIYIGKLTVGPATIPMVGISPTTF